jgi:hypothetical protein
MNISRDPEPLPDPASEAAEQPRQPGEWPRGVPKPSWGANGPLEIIRPTGIGDGCLGLSNDELPF